LNCAPAICYHPVSTGAAATAFNVAILGKLQRMTASITAIMNAEQIARASDDLAQAVVAGRRPDAPLVLVGIRTRGVTVAERLARLLLERHSLRVPVGALDITLYRDDLSQIAHAPLLHGTEVPFAVDGKEVVLVDDVLFTGRTIRAAMDAICDLGRPASIRLAVLIDRGQRELPIQPDYCAMRVATAPHERIDVLLEEVDGVDEVRKELMG
jgi:pyrimidine operon attenuation protein/uracil phosphoribosyltransferase